MTPRPPAALLRLSPSDPGAAMWDPARGLRVACLIWTALWSIGLLMNNVVGPLISPDRPLDDAWPFPANPVAFALIVLSLALFAASRRRDLPASRLTDLALLYEVALALGIGIVNQWTPNSAGLSWICVVILVHPLIVPAPPGKTLVAAVAAASMDLVGLAVSSARGIEPLAPSVILWTYLPNFLCAGLAVIPSRVRMHLEQARQTTRELGSYRVGALLSRGGMGEIYRAEHRMLVRPAAVKLVRPELLGATNEEGRRRIVLRFHREAKLTARLRSPHTVQVYDYGEAEDGTLYYVMELLTGFDLETLVRRFGPVPAERTAHVLLQVCDSLAEAHDHGLIHRDIKPSNVILCRYGRRPDFVKVLDFGLAKETAAAPDAESSLTRETSVPGTPAFMAPEQIVGGSPVGPWTDVYAVGCLGYWLTTGCLVFEGSSPLEVLTLHASATPEPPSARTELDVPAWLDRAILACLEKDPGRRPSSADALAELLAAAVPTEPWTTERATKWWDLHGAELTPPAGTEPSPIPERQES